MQTSRALRVAPSVLHLALVARASSMETVIDRWGKLALVDALAVNIANLRLAGRAHRSRVPKESHDVERRR